MNTRLDEIIREVTSKSLVGTISISIEKIAEEIAKETLNDEEFRESLRALTRAAAKQIMADLTKTHPVPPDDCGEQPDDSAALPELGQMRRIPDDDYYHEKYLDEQARLDWESRDK